MKKIEVKISGKEVLSRVSRMFDQTQESLFLEIFQNARRSGATEIYVKEIEGGIVIGNNGAPIEDFQNLLTLGYSEWDKDKDHEDPAGAGFFATTMCDLVKVSSFYKGKNEMITINPKKMSIEGQAFYVKNVYLKDKHFIKSTVEYILYGDFLQLTQRDYGGSIEKYMKRYPCDMYIQEDGTLRLVENDLKKKQNNVVYDTIKDGCRFRIYDTYKTDIEMNYYGSRINLNTFNLHYGVDMSITPEDNSFIKLVLPGRHTIIHDHNYDTLLNNISIVVGEYIMKNKQGKHYLGYNVYSRIKQFLPSFPEATKEIPDEKYLFISKTYEMYNNETACVNGLESVAVMEGYIYEKMKGYSWLDDYIVIHSIKVFYNNQCILDEIDGVFESGVYSNGEVYAVINGEFRDELDGIVLVDQDSYYYNDCDLIIIKKDFEVKHIPLLLAAAEDVHEYESDRNLDFDDDLNEMLDGVEGQIRKLINDTAATAKFYAETTYSKIRYVGAQNVLFSASSKYVFSSLGSGKELFIEKIPYKHGMTKEEKRAYLMDNMDDTLVEYLSEIVMEKENGKI